MTDMSFLILNDIFQNIGLAFIIALLVWGKK